jgi:hypothetical protein
VTKDINIAAVLFSIWIATEATYRIAIEKPSSALTFLPYFKTPSLPSLAFLQSARNNQAPQLTKMGSLVQPAQTLKHDADAFLRRTVQDLFSLSGRTIVIIGGARGIGLALASPLPRSEAMSRS